MHQGLLLKRKRDVLATNCPPSLHCLTVGSGPVKDRGGQEDDISEPDSLGKERGAAPACMLIVDGAASMSGLIIAKES